MARYVTASCTNKKCVNHEPMSSARLVGESGTDWFVECDECGTEWSRPAPQAIKRSNTYPTYSGSLGQVVQSREHEEKVAKDLGYTHMEHLRVKAPRRSKNPHNNRR